MQFSRQTIYDDKSVPIAGQIYIQGTTEDMGEDQVDLFERFLQIIIEEVDKKIDKFKLIIPAEFYPYMAKMNKFITGKLSIKIDVASHNPTSLDLMEQISNDGYSLTVEIKDRKVISLLPENTEYVIVEAGLMSLLEDELNFLKASYKCVAKDVDTRELFDELKELDVAFFCGEFIEKSEGICEDVISPNKTAVISLMNALSDPDVELDVVTKMVISHTVLSYKILRVVNSPAYRGVREITSVQEAIVRFGFNNLKKWVMMLSLCCLGDKPSALIKIALQRGVMCSKLAEHLKAGDTDTYYMAGMLSMIDAFLDKPIEKLLQDINISQDIQQGILAGKGTIGQVLDIVKKYQQGDVSFKDPKLTSIFIDSAEETNEIMRTVGM